MPVLIEKKKVFQYFKAKEIVQTHTDPTLEIVESKNRDKPGTLQKLTITGLNPTHSPYYLLHPENPTSVRPSNPTERVVIEDVGEWINLVFIEMKPPKGQGVFKKLERTFVWTYLLFNLLQGKENRELRVYLLLAKYSDSSLPPLICKGELKVLHNLTVRFLKKIYYSNGSEELQLEWSEVTAWPPKVDRCQKTSSEGKERKGKR